MSQYFALLSMVFMMSFVIMFDGMRWRHSHNRWLRAFSLLSQEEIGQVRLIWSACQDN